jgi:hypothetical protein
MINPPLSREQEFFVLAILMQDLMESYNMLKDGLSASGVELTRDERVKLQGYIDKLREVLLSFPGMSTPKLDDVARQSGPK